MTDEELHAIKARLELRGKVYDPDGEFWMSPTREQCLALVAEVERLRVAFRTLEESYVRTVTRDGERIAELERENAAMREIVQAVADAEYWAMQQAVMPVGIEYRLELYTATNLVEQARALLAREEEQAQ